MPLQPPDQPLNVAPHCDTPVSVTVVLAGKAALHCVGQLIPGGVDVTAPEPVTVTVTVWLPPPAPAKVAPTVTSAFSFTVQVTSVPEQAPVHPPKLAPASG